MRTKVAALAAGLVMMGAGMLWAEDAAANKEVTLKGTMECTSVNSMKPRPVRMCSR